MRMLGYKNYLFFFLVSILNNLRGQCVTTIIDPGLHNPVCTSQETNSYDSGIIRFNIEPMLGSNLYSFTTVGSSSEDTHLAFYNSSGVLLAQNDDTEKNWIGCKQSTIEYNTTIALNGTYVILSKKGCQGLTSPTSIWYNVINPYNANPIINEPNTPFYTCKDTTAQFKASNSDGTDTSSPEWKSSDPLIATITNTGFISFIGAGLVKIYLKGALNCEIFKTYLVFETVTSEITHD